MRDPYVVLGVARTATPDEVKNAYRKLARSMHPDVNRSDPRAEERFKEVSSAYHLLSDPQRRARFDRGEIDAQGNERTYRPGPGTGGFGFRSRRPAGDRGEGFKPGAGFGEDDLFSDMFRRASRGAGDANGAGAGLRPQRGQDAHYRLKVSFEEAALGCTRRITLTNRKTLDVRIPPGWEDGHTLRLKGQGAAGIAGGAAGDALVEIGVREHPVFRRDERNVIAEIPVTLREAVLGARITVPTLEGLVTLTVPEDSNTGTVLRLRGKGIPAEDAVRGDLLVHLRIVLPDPADPRLKAVVRKLKDPDVDPRTKAGLI
ncbi:DnaJ C-terminal domain-containing protein [Pararhodospirillum oryzae]|uniref:Molecular chaperone DnaJ n=1 Tax=Pararhodospirillum oryzae TaxID=478448 RepID=A0A512H7F9_9PROT|nr:J domain-containing protein [Pararhodospirillum oryzae]GEO81320.1 molecular chaperone DnaJ [Pararhodospirillum oryzae]